MMRFLSLGLGALLLSPLAAAETYDIDASHTTVGFKITHMGISSTVGRFGDVAGKVAISDGKLDATTADVTIKTTSVYTGTQKRDDHLRDDDFFKVSQFPEMTFKSKAVKNVTGDGFDLVGDLTMLGVTKEVTLKVTGVSKEIDDPWGGKRRGASATTTLKRSDFGMTWGLDNGALGDEVEIFIELELMRTP